MVVHSQLQSLEKRRFSVISAAHNEGDALRDSHSGDLAFMGKRHGDAQEVGEEKGTAFFMGREEIPLSRGSTAPSATKATSFCLESS